MTGVYDEALLRFRETGPEMRGWLSNHGPMAADALVRMDHAPDVGRWVDGYLPRLEDRPEARWPITEEGWRDPLGDASRLGDWLAFFERRLEERPWPEVLTEWWPRLLPGAIASATHALIRTGHAVRALLEEFSEPRKLELAQALGYWAARWAPLPSTRPGRGSSFAALPAVPDRGGARSRVAALSEQVDWASAASRGGLPGSDVEVALDDLVDAAVRQYGVWAAAEPVMLVHMATAPRAARLVLPALAAELWVPTYTAAWNVSAAIASMYRPSVETREPSAVDDEPRSLAADAAASGDEHAIKFTEVALESHARGNPAALPAARQALTHIP